MKVYRITDPRYNVPTSIWKDSYENWYIMGQDGGTYDLKLSRWKIQELINKEKI